MLLILGKQNLQLRANQVVVLNSLLKSKSKVTFIELGTGFGKSKAIIAPLADAARWATKAKSVVIVPTKILRAIQHEYCIAANQSVDWLVDPEQIDTFYCTYDTFLENYHLLSENANIIVDESHLFLKEKVRIINGKAVVPSQALKRFLRVFMLSATFGGQQGIAELQKMFKRSLFIHSPKELAQKDLSQIEVIGNLADREAVLKRATEIIQHKMKELPIILFCKDDQECSRLKQIFQDASMFGENTDTSELLDVIRKCKGIARDKIILTTQKACIGIDFIFKVLRCFVIFTEDASYIEELLQSLGRSSRIDVTLPLLGVVITQRDCNDIQSLEKGLKDKSADLKIFGKQTRDNIGMLSSCRSARTDKQQERLQQAIDLFNSQSNDQRIKGELSNIKDFKQAIEEYFKETNKEMFTLMITKDTNVAEVQSIASLLEIYQVNTDDLALIEDEELSEAIALGKRIQRDQQKDDKEYQTLQMKRLKLNVEQLSENFEQQDAFMQNEEQVDSFLTTEEQQQILQQPYNNQQNHSNYSPGFNEQREQQHAEFEMDPEALKQKEITEAKDILQKHGIKTFDQQEQVQSFIKPKSILSFNTTGKKAKTVCGEREATGRFKQKYKIGDKSSDGSIIKEINEGNWQKEKKDMKGNWYFKCLKCGKENVRQDHRRIHKCKIVA